MILEILIVSLNVSALFFFLLFFFKRYLLSESKNLVISSFLIKILLTLIFSVIFKFYFSYTTDADVYFHKAVELKSFLIHNKLLFKDALLYNKIPVVYYVNDRTYFFIKIVTLLHFITSDNYWLDNMWLSGFNFCCIWYLCVNIKSIIHHEYKIIIFILLFLPIPMIWTSGLLKETIAFSMLCLLSTFSIHIFKSNNTSKYLLFSMPCAYVLFQLKFYVLGAFLLTIIPGYIIFKISQIFKVNKTILILNYFVLLFVLFICANYLSKNLFSAGIFELIYYNYETFLIIKKTNFQFLNLSTDVNSFFPYLHIAFWQGLFMPLPLLENSPLMLMESIFNLFILVLMVLSLIVLFKEKILLSYMFIFLILYLIICSTAFGFSNPNWGTLSRYKVYYSPVLYYIILSILKKSIAVQTFLNRVKGIRLF